MSTFTSIFSKETVAGEAKAAKAAARGRSREAKAAARETWKAFKASGLKEAKAELKAFIQKAKAEIKTARKSKADREVIKYLKLVLRLTKKYFKIMIKSLRLGCSTVEEFKGGISALFYIAEYTLKNPSERGLETARATAELSDADLEEDDIDDEEYEATDDPNEISDAEVISEIYDQFGNLAAGGKGKIVNLAAAVTADETVKPCPDPRYYLPETTTILMPAKYETGSNAVTTIVDSLNKKYNIEKYNTDIFEAIEIIQHEYPGMSLRDAAIIAKIWLS